MHRQAFPEISGLSRPRLRGGGGLILYLSPDKCRAAKSTKLRLRKFTPLLHRGTNTAQEIKPVLTYMSDQDTCLSHYTIYHFKNARPVLEKKTWALQEKRFLVHFLLTLLMSNTSSKSKALLHHDLSLFQKAHTLLWTQGNGQIINFLWHRLHS